MASSLEKEDEIVGVHRRAVYWDEPERRCIRSSWFQGANLEEEFSIIKQEGFDPQACLMSLFINFLLKGPVFEDG